METPHKDTTTQYHETKVAETPVNAPQGIPPQSPYAIPGAIVIAGAIIAGAVLYSGGSAGGQFLPSQGAAKVPTEEGQQASADGIRPVDGTDFIVGNPNAPVKIVTFSDLECPFCKRFHFTMKEAMEKYGSSGEVAWVFRHFPLDTLHEQARPEAIAAECVGQLGGNDAFWKYLDSIFTETTSNDGLDLAMLDVFATDLSIDATAFTDCRNGTGAGEAVEADFQDAITSGGTGTPYSVIIAKDGSKTAFSGAQPLANVERAIKEALAK